MNQTPTAGRVKSMLAGVAFALVVVAVVIFFAMRRDTKRQQTIDKAAIPYDRVLGLEPTADIDEDGFHATEQSKSFADESYRWTNGAAKFIIPLAQEPPRWLFVRLGLPIPRTLRLTLKVNGQSLFDADVAMKREWERTFDLSTMPLGRSLTLEIVSSTFIPAEDHKGSTDGRTLGVCVRGIMLVSAGKEFVNVPLGGRIVPGIAEEGFSWPEQAGGEPCRWTNGAAWLDVPLREKAPKSLSLASEIPNRPNHRVRIAVNGQVLFEDVVAPNLHWTIELPLAGVELKNNALIEVGSSTFVPSETMPGSKDDRALGVRVKWIVLNHP
jgi:hypothetical protein